MLLAIDIGNSNIVIGGIDEEKIRFEARVATDRIKTSDQYGVEIKNMLDLFRVPVEEVEDCIISSVVPPVFNAVRTGVVKVTGLEPIVVGPGIKTGLNIQMDDPASVGSDRIVIAVAALQEYKPPIILVDMGTATTMEVVDHGNTYLGGCIIPGVRVSAEALSSRASQLPGIQLDKPRRVIGKNTVECMRSGIMYGAAAMLDGMLDRMEEELGKRTTVVVTGGMAQFIADVLRPGPGWVPASCCTGEQMHRLCQDRRRPCGKIAAEEAGDVGGMDAFGRSSGKMPDSRWKMWKEISAFSRGLTVAKQRRL